MSFMQLKAMVEFRWVIKYLREDNIDYSVSGHLTEGAGVLKTSKLSQGDFLQPHLTRWVPCAQQG